MAKNGKNSQQRSKGERLNWGPVSKDSGKLVSRDVMTGRFLTAANGRDRDSQVTRNGVKQLVP